MRQLLLGGGWRWAIGAGIAAGLGTLKPWTAQNYDLSAEYYTDNGGLVTAGVFRKDLRDFFGSTPMATVCSITNTTFSFCSCAPVA